MTSGPKILAMHLQSSISWPRTAPAPRPVPFDEANMMARCIGLELERQRYGVDMRQEGKQR